MSTDIEERLREYLASAPQTRYALEVVSISHSALTRTYNLWGEALDGEVTDEDGNVLEVQSTNFNVVPAGSEANLDQMFRITIDTTDQENVLRKELDRIPLSTNERIVVVYRVYMSDYLTEPQAVQYLQAEGIAFTRGAATISAGSPRLNILRTGALYTMSRFPMLRGFL